MFAWLRSDSAQAGQKPVGREARAGAAMTAAVTAGEDGGVFSHDVIPANDSTATFGSCDPTLTVHLTTGKRPAVRQYRATWGPKERKKVNVSAGGAVERVDLAGTPVDSATGEKGLLEATFEWKPKPDPPPPAR